MFILQRVCYFITAHEDIYLPVALVLAMEEAHNVGLGVPELGLCKGLTELLRAFRSEFGVVDVLTDKAVGPKRPAPKIKDELQRPVIEKVR